MLESESILGSLALHSWLGPGDQVQGLEFRVKFSFTDSRLLDGSKFYGSTLELIHYKKSS